jgi:DNA-binding NarL/FixJ family response regulator
MVPFRVVLADDYSGLRAALRAILHSTGEFEVVGEAGDGSELLDLLQSGAAPDIVVLDLMMPTMTGLKSLDEIGKLQPGLKVLVLTMHKEPDLLCRAFRSGADGYLLKDETAKELVPALRSVLSGNVYLSPSIRPELPDTCRIKALSGIQPPAGFAHCR